MTIPDKTLHPAHLSFFYFISRQALAVQEICRRMVRSHAGETMGGQFLKFTGFNEATGTYLYVGITIFFVFVEKKMPITLSAGPACYKASYQNAATANQPTIASAQIGQDPLCFGKNDQPQHNIKKGLAPVLLAMLGLAGCDIPSINNVTPGGLQYTGWDLNEAQSNQCNVAADKKEQELKTAKKDTKSYYFACLPGENGSDIRGVLNKISRF